MDKEDINKELSNLKDTFRFFYKLNIGILVGLFAFISFLSDTPGEAIDTGIQFKVIIGVLIMMVALGLFCEYLLSVKTENDDYLKTLKTRLKHGRIALKAYIIAWIILIFLSAYMLITLRIINNPTIP